MTNSKSGKLFRGKGDNITFAYDIQTVLDQGIKTKSRLNDPGDLVFRTILRLKSTSSSLFSEPVLHLKPIRLNHVTLAAPLDGKVAARRFYGEILGLQEIHIPPVLSGAYDMVWYKILDWELHVVFTDDWTDKPVLSRHFALEIEDYHEFRAHLENHGVPLTEGVPLPDRERFYFQDPFQIYFEVIKLNAR